MNPTEQAIRLRQLLRDAGDIVSELDTRRTDEESEVLYRILCLISSARSAVTESPELSGVFDRQAVIDATLVR